MPSAARRGMLRSSVEKSQCGPQGHVRNNRRPFLHHHMERRAILATILPNGRAAGGFVCQHRLRWYLDRLLFECPSPGQPRDDAWLCAKTPFLRSHGTVPCDPISERHECPNVACRRRGQGVHPEQRNSGAAPRSPLAAAGVKHIEAGASLHRSPTCKKCLLIFALRVDEGTKKKVVC